MTLEIIYYPSGSLSLEDDEVDEAFYLTSAEVDQLIATLAKHGRLGPDGAGLYTEPACQECGQALITNPETTNPTCSNCGVVNQNG